MAEVLASLKKIGGSGEQYTETVLWTNPSPTAQFAGQAVTLSDSISNYKYIKITNNFSTAYPTIIGSTIFPVEDFKTAIYPVTGRQWQPRIGMGDASTNYARRVYYVSETSIQITSANLVTSGQGGANNNNAIPLEILGINELAHKTTIAMDLIGEVSLPANTATVTCTTTQNISDYKNLFITTAEYNGSALVTTSVASPPLQFVDTEYFASNSVTGYYAAGSTLTSYSITMQKLSDTSIQFTRPTASGTRQVYVYGIK